VSTALVDVAALIDEAVEIIEAGSTSGALVALRLIDREYPTIDSTLRELASQGLAGRINNELHYRRGREVDGSAADATKDGLRPRHSVPRLVAADSRLWTTLYQAADGMQKSFIRFSRDDLLSLIDKARGQLGGWAKTLGKAEKALAALDEYHVEHVFELPEDAIRAIEEARWGRGSR